MILTHQHCIIPDWPAPANVHALITTRLGGVSTGRYASLNLGRNSADAPAAVATNHAALRMLLPQDPRWLAQVHGTRVVTADRLDHIPDADGAIARLPGTVCAISIADCLPVLFTDIAGTMVAAAHAGWRGLAGGIIENTVSALHKMGAQPDTLLAYLGPGIGPDAFEVGPEVFDTFAAYDRENIRAFTSPANGKRYADLFLLARLALRRAGITRIFGGGVCTYSNPEHFYSYRRDGLTGRMAALIWKSDATALPRPDSATEAG